MDEEIAIAVGGVEVYKQGDPPWTSARYARRWIETKIESKHKEIAEIKAKILRLEGQREGLLEALELLPLPKEKK